MEMTQERLFTMCACPNCPSWVACSEKGGYCVVGKSGCITKEKGCICGTCPVLRELHFKRYYFCTRDSEAVQQGKK